MYDDIYYNDGSFAQPEYDDSRWQKPHYVQPQHQQQQHQSRNSTSVASSNPNRTDVRIVEKRTDAASFTPDIDCKEIIAGTHPEMANAMINMAIKKFAKSEIFLKYFAKVELLETLKMRAELEQQVEEIAESPESNSRQGMTQQSQQVSNSAPTTTASQFEFKTWD